MNDSTQTYSHPKPRVVAAGEFLTFRLGAEEYAIDILKVQEIRRCEAPTRIANAPAAVKGVVNLRGAIVPIVDLSAKLGLNGARADELAVVIVLNVVHRIVGIVVDSVSDVIALTAAQIKPAPEFDTTLFDSSYITGLGSVETGGDERMLILTDIEQLMRSVDLGLIDSASLH